jgi:hypothetical protein
VPGAAAAAAEEEEEEKLYLCLHICEEKCNQCQTLGYVEGGL